MKFSEEFWDQFETVNRNVENGLAAVQQLSEFFKKRAALEATIGKSLSALCKSFPASSGGLFSSGPSGIEQEPETIKGAIISYREESKRIAAKHTEFAGQITTDICAPLDQFLKINSNERKKLFDEGTKKSIARNKAIANSKIAHDQYTKLNQTLEDAITASDVATKEAKANPGKAHLERKAKNAAEKIGSMVKRLASATSGYRDSVETANALTRELFTTTLPKILDAMQEIEESRFEVMASSLKGYSSHQESVASLFIEICDDMVQHADKANLDSFLDHYVTLHKKSKADKGEDDGDNEDRIPALLEYQPYESDLVSEPQDDKEERKEEEEEEEEKEKEDDKEEDKKSKEKEAEKEDSASEKKEEAGIGGFFGRLFSGTPKKDDGKKKEVEKDEDEDEEKKEDADEEVEEEEEEEDEEEEEEEKPAPRRTTQRSTPQKKVVKEDDLFGDSSTSNSSKSTKRASAIDSFFGDDADEAADDDDDMFGDGNSKKKANKKVDNDDEAAEEDDDYEDILREEEEREKREAEEKGAKARAAKLKKAKAERDAREKQRKQKEEDIARVAEEAQKEQEEAAKRRTAEKTPPAKARAPRASPAAAKKKKEALFGDDDDMFGFENKSKASPKVEKKVEEKKTTPARKSRRNASSRADDLFSSATADFDDFFS